ncbi:MAG: PT domain-containing protein [Rickettsiales bacterium]|nr:PT domain-containing protein [Rickettsiales bacterium]
MSSTLKDLQKFKIEIAYPYIEIETIIDEAINQYANEDDNKAKYRAERIDLLVQTYVDFNPELSKTTFVIPSGVSTTYSVNSLLDYLKDFASDQPSMPHIKQLLIPASINSHYAALHITKNDAGEISVQYADPLGINSMPDHLRNSLISGLNIKEDQIKVSKTILQPLNDNRETSNERCDDFSVTMLNGLASGKITISADNILQERDASNNLINFENYSIERSNKVGAEINKFYDSAIIDLDALLKAEADQYIKLASENQNPQSYFESLYDYYQIPDSDNYLTQDQNITNEDVIQNANGNENEDDDEMPELIPNDEEPNYQETNDQKIEQSATTQSTAAENNQQQKISDRTDLNQKTSKSSSRKTAETPIEIIETPVTNPFSFGSFGSLFKRLAFLLAAQSVVGSTQLGRSNLTGNNNLKEGINLPSNLTPADSLQNSFANYNNPSFSLSDELIQGRRLQTRRESKSPSFQPTISPTNLPTDHPTYSPTAPTLSPTYRPTFRPSGYPTGQPTRQPSGQPTVQPSDQPTAQPTSQPNLIPTSQPSDQPTGQPSDQPTSQPSSQPSGQPTSQPSDQPTEQPTLIPSSQPSGQPTSQPSDQPTAQPTSQPTLRPSSQPSGQPTGQPTEQPTLRPSGQPTGQPTAPTPAPIAASSSGRKERDVRTSHYYLGGAQALFGLCTLNPASVLTGVSVAAYGEAIIENDQTTDVPTMQPAYQPSGQPTGQPTSQPSGQPSRQPTAKPNHNLTNQTSAQPTNRPNIAANKNSVLLDVDSDLEEENQQQKSESNSKNQNETYLDYQIAFPLIGQLLVLAFEAWRNGRNTSKIGVAEMLLNNLDKQSVVAITLALNEAKLAVAANNDNVALAADDNFQKQLKDALNGGYISYSGLAACLNWYMRTNYQSLEIELKNNLGNDNTFRRFFGEQIKDSPNDLVLFNSFLNNLVEKTSVNSANNDVGRIEIKRRTGAHYMDSILPDKVVNGLTQAAVAVGLKEENDIYSNLKECLIKVLVGNRLSDDEINQLRAIMNSPRTSVEAARLGRNLGAALLPPLRGA